MDQPDSRYTMRISRLTVDKLGVKLYDKVSAVLAELVANAYDADAEQVTITAPMGELLATKANGVVLDKGYSIIVEDSGHGMTPDEIMQFYLVVGKERRSDPSRGARSRNFERRVMGRKGVGKLAPFGICSEVEIVSSGGELVDGTSPSGDQARGYLTANLTLNSREILTDTETDYHPIPGPLDGTVREYRGTTITLRQFDRRWVPEMEDLSRQLSQRFGIQQANWRIELRNSQVAPGTNGYAVEVGAFDVSINPTTKLTFSGTNGQSEAVTDAENSRVPQLRAGFEYEGAFYPINGWVAYSSQPYKDELMAGVRIYCNGKIAAQTVVFEHKAGFTGEHDIRSYLVGELHANWLDSSEDLIQTDRRDILWSSDLGIQFQTWGQRVIKFMGANTRRAVRLKSWDTFREASRIEERVQERFPGIEFETIRTTAIGLAKQLGEKIRADELNNRDQIELLTNLSLRFAPHLVLNDELTRAAADAATPLEVISSLLSVARVAELSTFGQIAERRVDVIKRLEELKDGTATTEGPLQSLLTEAPWLIDPQWSPVTANRSFSTLKAELEKYFSRQGTAVTLDSVEPSNRRVDFALANHDGYLEIVEIKRPGKAFDDDDFNRFWVYTELFSKFWSLPGNQDVIAGFPKGYRFTIVADGIALTSRNKAALNDLEHNNVYTHVSWASFLTKARNTHEDFLKEAERQMRLNTLGDVSR